MTSVRTTPQSREPLRHSAARITGAKTGSAHLTGAGAAKPRVANGRNAHADRPQNKPRLAPVTELHPGTHWPPAAQSPVETSRNRRCGQRDEFAPLCSFFQSAGALAMMNSSGTRGRAALDEHGSLIPSGGLPFEFVIASVISAAPTCLSRCWLASWSVTLSPENGRRCSRAAGQMMRKTARGRGEPRRLLVSPRRRAAISASCPKNGSMNRRARGPPASDEGRRGTASPTASSNCHLPLTAGCWMQ